MSIKIRKSGILTTVQDLGRTRFRRFSINPGGVMDAAAARLINILLENDENEAVIEMHFPAAEIAFEENALFAVGGADFAAELDDKKVDNWRIHFAEKQSVLRFPQKISGNRAYFSIKGGFEIEKWLGSAGTNLKAKIGGVEGRPLKPGDELFFRQTTKEGARQTNFKISGSLIPFYSRFPTVRVVAGAEFELLSTSGYKHFLEETFVISQNSDRMGFRLEGKPIRLSEIKEIVSSAVNYGTIQLLPDGQVIVLMADHQTSGGYPRIANVISTDLPLLGQLGANEKVAFHLVSLEEAENLSFEFEKNLNLLKIAVNLTK
ncbi:MAG TPA: biotin-dependent carboxyltransferase family protein [Pyrinomonadaceae bacterium]|jgi:antagonist of KipI